MTKWDRLYLSTANKMIDCYLQTPKVNIKKLFYIILPLLACNWIVNNKTMQPTPFKKIFIKRALPDYIFAFINDLLIEKKKTSEKDEIKLPIKFSNWLKKETQNVKNAAKHIPHGGKTGWNALNQIMLSFVKI